MRLRSWDTLPERMRTEEVRPYYEHLSHKRGSLLFKRVFDLAAASVLLLALSPVFALLAAVIKLDSPGPVFFRQVRLTQYGREFRIFKFRTMAVDADSSGTQVTLQDDQRITRVGKWLRKYRLDETAQLLNVLSGSMTFVGTRPEVPKYVAAYTKEMWATLLLPAGITSEASICYKDEDRLLKTAGQADEIYVSRILPEKMAYNLRSLANFHFLGDLRTMLRTVMAVFRKDASKEGGRV